MHISTLTLRDFRNYSMESISFSPGTNVIYGDNAQGKTNILEAVYLFNRGKSHRTKSDAEIVRFGSQRASAIMEFSDRHREFKGIIQIDRGGKKAVKINNVAIAKLSKLMNYFHAVLFSPEDLMLVKGSPGQRRRFMDAAISQLYPKYLVSLTAYQKAMMQKNSLLKILRKNGKKSDPTLSVWNDSMAREGAVIMKYRGEFLAAMGLFAAGIQKEISGEELRLEYRPSVGDGTGEMDYNALYQYLEERSGREIEMASAQYGIQRDDIGVLINGRDAKIYGSQGQKRTAALSLKMAQAEHINDVREEYPVLLLDDIMSELDTGRRNYLNEKIRDKQVLITCTDADILPLSGGSKLIRVRDGHISDG